MINYDADVMIASPQGIRILRLHGEPAYRFYPPYIYSLLRCEFDDDSDQHAPIMVYETAHLVYEPQVSR